MSRLSALLARASRHPIQGRPIRATGARRRSRAGLRSGRTRRDAAIHTSDTVWEIVERMMAGDAGAALILNDVIEEGVRGGTTKFVKITRKGGRIFGKPYAAEVQEGQFAAITPGRSIVLFGVKKFYPREPGHNFTGAAVMKGYLRRFAIGDTAKVGSYNLVYMGTIVGITAKQVTVHEGRGHKSNRVFDIERFNNQNRDFDIDKAITQNQNWSD